MQINLKFLYTFFLFIVWANLISQTESFYQDFKHIDCQLKAIVNPSCCKSAGQDRAFPGPHLPIKQGTSTNWSGYVSVTNINNPAKGSVTAVSGTWNVPQIFKSNRTTYSSIWVGIDGYTSATVEQLGTEHDWVNGHQRNYAWFEMFPAYPFEITGFPVKIGDSISAAVVYLGSNIFKLSIFNNTRKVYTIIPSSYTTSSKAQRSSAEWVVEAPSLNGVLPLAHFSPVTFRSCSTTIKGVPGSISKNIWKNDALTMVTRAGIPKAVSSALLSNGKKFSVAWKHE